MSTLPTWYLCKTSSRTPLVWCETQTRHYQKGRERTQQRTYHALKVNNSAAGKQSVNYCCMTILRSQRQRRPIILQLVHQRLSLLNYVDRIRCYQNAILETVNIKASWGSSLLQNFADDAHISLRTCLEKPSIHGTNWSSVSIQQAGRGSESGKCLCCGNPRLCAVCVDAPATSQ